MEGDRFVEVEGSAVLGEFHFAGDGAGVGGVLVDGFFERPGFDGFVVDVEVHQAFAGFGERAEGGGEGDAGEFLFEVGGETFAVGGVVEDGVDVVEEVFLGDGGVGSKSRRFHPTEPWVDDML